MTIRNVVDVPASGRVSVTCGVTTGGVTTGFGVTLGFGSLPVDAITALGLVGALSDAPARVTGTVNSRIESTPALIVISVIESADVIVRTYEAQAVSGVAVWMTAAESDAPVLGTEIDAILILSLVAWSMIRTRIESTLIAWLNIRSMDFASLTLTVSSNNGVVFWVESAPWPGIAVSAAETLETSVNAKINIVTTSVIRDISIKVKKYFIPLSVVKMSIKARETRYELVIFLYTIDIFIFITNNGIRPFDSIIFWEAIFSS